MSKKIFILSSLFSTTALAEVADKEPSVWINVAVSFVTILIGLALIRFRWWLFPASLLLVVGSHIHILSEIYDTSVGPAIRNELGSFYVWQPQFSAVFGVAIVILYVVFRRWRNRLER